MRRAIQLGEADLQTLRLEAERDYMAKQKRLSINAEKASKARKRKARKAARRARAGT